jgi:hypothetical protein
MFAVRERTIVSSEKATLLISRNDFVIRVDEDVYLASDNLDRFCRLLAAYWPIKEAESYRWMINRLVGAKCLFTDTCDGQAAVPTGKPVNIFGVTQRCVYAPLSPWDNMVDVITCIRQAYA